MSCLMIPGKLNVQLLQGWEKWVVASKMQGSEEPFFLMVHPLSHINSKNKKVWLFSQKEKELWKICTQISNGLEVLTSHGSDLY